MQCAYCTKTFLSDEFLRSHMVRRHPDKPLPQSLQARRAPPPSQPTAAPAPSLLVTHEKELLELGSAARPRGPAPRQGALRSLRSATPPSSAPGRSPPNTPFVHRLRAAHLCCLPEPRTLSTPFHCRAYAIPVAPLQQQICTYARPVCSSRPPLPSIRSLA